MKRNTKGCTKGPKNVRKPHKTPYESPTVALRKPYESPPVVCMCYEVPPFVYPFLHPFEHIVTLSYPFRTPFAHQFVVVFWYVLVICVTFYNVAGHAHTFPHLDQSSLLYNWAEPVGGHRGIHHRHAKGPISQRWRWGLRMGFRGTSWGCGGG